MDRFMQRLKYCTRLQTNAGLLIIGPVVNTSITPKPKSIIYKKGKYRLPKRGHFLYASLCLGDLCSVLNNKTSQRTHSCTENVLKTRFQDVQSVNSEGVHKT